MSNAVVLCNINEEMDRRGTKRSYFDQLVDGKAPTDHFLTVKQEPEDEELIEQTDSSNYSESSSEEITPPVKRYRGRPPKSQKTSTKEQVLYNRHEERSLRTRETQMRNTDGRRSRVVTEKTVFTYPMILTMVIMNSPNQRATVTMLYDSVIYLFPCLEASVHWKNTLRHALAPKEGFLKEDPLSRSSYWRIMPDRKEGLLQSINDIVAQYKNPKYLMMRNIDDLPFILAGTYVFPKEAGVINMSSSYNEPRPATALEFKKALQQNKIRYTLTDSPIVKSKPVDNKEVEEIPEIVYARPTERVSPQYRTKDRTVPYTVTSRHAERVSPQEMQRRVAAEGSPAGWTPYSVDPNYSNHWQPAHQPVYMYGGPESVYGAPMYEYEDEERESVTPPSHKRYVLINDTKSSVGSSSSRPRTNIFHQRRNLHQQ